jgi:peptide/nickel transport system permease protein
MRAYLIRRLLLIIPSFLGITFIIFLIMQCTPGDPTRLAMTKEGGLQTTRQDKGYSDEMRKLYGLDKPVYVQYIRWLGNLCTFNFGRSYMDWRPIGTKILERIPVTLSLSVISLIVVYIIALPVGVLAAVRQNSLVDRVITILLFILYSLPGIWVGVMLILFFAGTRFLDWFPLRGLHGDGAETMPFFAWLGDALWHLVLPVVVMTYGGFASLSRYMRSGMLEVIRQDYIRTARAKGLSEKSVILKHAMRNSLIPLVTISVMALPGLIAGSVIVEQIFSLPGMGLLFYEAAFARDYYTVMAISAIEALLVLVSLVFVDIFYALADPRISYD